MPIFQPGGTNSGYRAPAKTQTIKALQDRQKAMLAASEAAAANAAPVTNIAQGFGALANQLGDSFQQNRVASQESDARAQLAGIMAQIDPNQGASMEQIAAMQQLDPDFANKEYTRAMEQRAAIANREDEQTFTGGQNDLTRQAEADRQRELFGHQDQTAATLVRTNEDAAISADTRADENADDTAGRDEHQARINAALQTVQAQRAAQVADGSLSAAEADRLNQLDIEALNAQIDKTKVGTNFGPIKTAGELGIGGVDPGTPYQQDVNTKEWQPVNKGGGVTVNNATEKAFDAGTGTAAAKRLDDYIQQGASAKEFIGQARIVADLGKNIGTGKWAEIKQQIGPWAEALGVDVTGLGDIQAYKAITDKMAPNMRVQGAGSSSDFDARQFLNSLQSLGNDPAGNQIIEATFEAVTQAKMAAAEIAAKAQSKAVNPATGQPYTWQEAEAEIRALPDPYTTYKKFMADAGKAPVDAGGGGGGGGDPARPADIPQAEWDAMPPEDKALFK